MDADKREEIKDLVRMMHAELSKDCPLRAEVKILWWKFIALIALAGATGGTASELVSWAKLAGAAAQAAGAGP